MGSQERHINYFGHDVGLRVSSTTSVCDNKSSFAKPFKVTLESVFLHQRTTVNFLCQKKFLKEVKSLMSLLKKLKNLIMV